MVPLFLYKNYPAFKYKNYTVIFNYKKGNFVETSDKLLKNDRLLKEYFEEDFILKYKEFNQLRPILTLILTRDCNMRCRYCSVFGGKYKKAMPLKVAINSVKHIISNNPEEILLIFFGGEPTLEINIIKNVINYLKQKYRGRINLAISTNGVINSSTTDYLIRNHFVINLSVDGLPCIQNFQRPLATSSGSAQIIKKTIKSLVKNKAVFKVRSTVTNYSVNRMVDSLKYFINLGVEMVHFEPLNICGRAESTNLCRPDRKEYIKNYKKCIEIATENNVTLVNGLYNNLLEPSYDYCEAVSGAKIVVTPEGYITRCYEVQDKSSLYFKDFIIGKVTKKDFEINNKKLEKLENLLKTKRKKCQKCFAKFICSGGCPLRHNPYRCNINRALIGDAIIRTWKSSKLS